MPATSGQISGLTENVAALLQAALRAEHRRVVLHHLQQDKQDTPQTGQQGERVVNCEAQLGAPSKAIPHSKRPERERHTAINVHAINPCHNIIGYR